MQNPVQVVFSLRRPRLLLRAARIGLKDYRRERSLRRITQNDTAPEPRRAVDALIAMEDNLNRARKTRDASYSAARHVEVMIALLAEARLLNGPRAVT